MTEKTLPFRKNACCLVISETHKIILLRRPLHESWEFVQGGVEQNETIKDTIQRELKEETGITNAEIIGESKHTDSYIWSKQDAKRKGFIGQERRFFLIKVKGEPELNLEKGEGGWFSFNQVHKRVKFEKLQKAFDEIKKEFPQYFE